MFSWPGEVAFSDSTIMANTAVEGGGLYVTGGQLNLVNSIVAGNAATGSYGGGILTYDTNTVITNSTIAGNSAADFGGGIASAGTLTVASSTIAGNSAGTFGGGIRAAGPLTVANSIVARNSATSDGPDVYQYSGTTTGSHTLLGDGAGQTSLVHGVNGNQVGNAADPIDPLFVDLQTRLDIVGPDGVFGTADDGSLGDYRLLAGSPAIDAGNHLFLDETDADGQKYRYTLVQNGETTQNVTMRLQRENQKLVATLAWTTEAESAEFRFQKKTTGGLEIRYRYAAGDEEESGTMEVDVEYDTERETYCYQYAVEAQTGNHMGHSEYSGDRSNKTGMNGHHSGMMGSTGSF